MRMANGEDRFGAQGRDRTGEACQNMAQIVEAGAMLLAERPLEALTVDAVVDAAGGVKAHQANGKKISSTKRCATAAQRLESALASVRRTP